MMKNIVRVFFTLTSTTLLSACAAFSSGSNADFAIPGCEQAWDEVNKAKMFNELRTLVSNDCPNLYQPGWRLALGNLPSGTGKPGVCNSAFARINSAGQADNVKFMVTHNCPVFYRHGWIIPPR